MKASDKLPIYLDYAATTPVDTQVLEAMMPYFTTNFGNSSSRFHAYGWLAEDALEEAKGIVSEVSGFSDKEIVFTSGATESINLALKGFIENFRESKHLITVKTEHKATLDTCEWIEKKGHKVTYLDVNANGQIDLNDLEKAIVPETVLVSVMQVNNETGIIQPLDEIIAIAKERNIRVHVDATQGVGKLQLPNEADLLSFSGHKIYAPKGVGILLVKKDTSLNSQIHGGKQQRNRRSGTLNIPGIIGIAEALSLAEKNRKEERLRISSLTKLLESSILDELQHVKTNGSDMFRAPGISNLCFKGLDGEELLMRMNKIAVSNGSACNSASTEPSYVLRAMGLSEAEAYSSIRFSLGRFTTLEEIKQTAEHVIEVAKDLYNAN